MKADCRKIKESSAYVKRWARNQPEVKEESITDWLLYDVSKKVATITYKAFSRHEEARDTGADWEWWFLFPTYSMRMRVQAKKVYVGEDNYPAIAYTNRYGLQIEKLLQNSTDINFMALYAFYTSSKSPFMCQEREGHRICRKRPGNEGVFISGGDDVYADFVHAGRRRVEVSDIVARSLPLSCFACCPLVAHEPEGFIRFLSKYFPRDVRAQGGLDTQPNDRSQIRGLYREVANYIKSFIDNAQAGIADWWEREYQADLKEVNSLVVHDQRSRQSRSRVPGARDHPW